MPAVIGFMALAAALALAFSAHAWMVDEFVPVWEEGGGRPLSGPSASGKKITNFLGMEFVWIEPGTFLMGSPSSEADRDGDESQHQVTLTKGFYMQTTEVTQGQWKVVMGNNPSAFSNCGDNCPVEQVSWNDVQEFIHKLNSRTGEPYRLPTEAEWEYACRAGSNTPFNTGDSLSTDQANYDDGNSRFVRMFLLKYSRVGPLPVKGFPPNAWGLYDMHGNVWEWCADWYGDYPPDSVVEPTGPSSGSTRVLRGGGWYFLVGGGRSADRNRRAADTRSPYFGFRLVCLQAGR